MRWWAVILAILCLVAWVIIRFVVAVASGLIHILLGLAVLLLLIAMIRGATSRSGTP